MVRQTLGARIRDLRQKSALTLSALAGAAGLSTSYMNDIEHDRTVPTLGKLGAVATALGVSVRDLLLDVDPYDIPKM